MCLNININQPHWSKNLTPPALTQRQRLRRRERGASLTRARALLDSCQVTVTADSRQVTVTAHAAYYEGSAARQYARRSSKSIWNFAK